MPASENECEASTPLKAFRSASVTGPNFPPGAKRASANAMRSPLGKSKFPEADTLRPQLAELQSAQLSLETVCLAGRRAT